MKIFVSYSRRDARDFAEKISETLEDEHSIFTDVEDIQLGDLWSNIIEDNIASCDIFLIIVTFAALRSPEVEKEVLEAQNKNKKIIPCFYGRIKRNELKWGLEQLQGIEFINEDQLAREIFWKINLFQSKGQPNIDSSIQPKTNPAIYSKEEKVKETTVDKTEESKPKVDKTEVPSEIGLPVEPYVKSPEVEQKYRFSSKRIILILAIVIGVAVAGIVSAYYKVVVTQVVVTQDGINRPPIAIDQSSATNVNTPLAISLSASDKNNDELTATIISPPLHGQLGPIDQKDGSLTYTPTSGFIGTDKFTFKVNDGKLDSNAGTVKITILSNNYPPKALDQLLKTSMNKSVDIMLKATDKDSNDELTATIISPPLHGQLGPIDQKDGSLTYTPTSGFIGTDKFTFKVNDGKADSDIASVSVTVK